MIAALFRFIIGDCWRHEWEEIDHGELHRAGLGCVGSYQVRRCKKCLKVKRESFRN